MEKELAAWKPDCIVCDEGHKIKTHNIAASKALHRLGAKARYRLLLTGTVITNKPIDVFSQHKFADPAVFGSSFYLFRNRYFDMVGYGNYTPVMKKSMEAEFTEKLHSIAFRATKAECLDLPECTDIVQRVELEPAARRVYLQLVKDSYADLANGSVTVTNVLTRLLRLSQLTSGFVGNDEDAATVQVSSAKLDALSDLLDSAENDGHKVVVIARFLPEIHAIEKLLQKKGLRYAMIHGGVTDRPAQIEAFQNDPDVRVFVGQIATAGLGITLTAASTMIFYSLDYSMSNYEQTRARIHRVGQKHPCTYIHLVAKDTVDEKVYPKRRLAGGRGHEDHGGGKGAGRADRPAGGHEKGNRGRDRAGSGRGLPPSAGNALSGHGELDGDCPSDEYLSDAGLQVARQEPRTGGRGSTAEGSVCGCVNMERKN